MLVEHRNYRGARAPSRLVFDEYEAFCEDLEAEPIAGDARDVWAWDGLCTPERRLAARCPAEDIMVPRRGAY